VRRAIFLRVKTWIVASNFRIEAVASTSLFVNNHNRGAQQQAAGNRKRGRYNPRRRSGVITGGGSSYQYGVGKLLSLWCERHQTWRCARDVWAVRQRERCMGQSPSRCGYTTAHRTPCHVRTHAAFTLAFWRLYIGYRREGAGVYGHGSGMV